MSNNVVSQQLSMPNAEVSQMEPTYANVDSAVNMQMGMMGPIPNVYASHQFEISNQRLQSVDPPYISGPQNFTVSNTQLGNTESTLYTMGLQKLIPDQRDGQMDGMSSISGSQKLFYQNKRKAAGEPMLYSNVPQQLSMPNKRAAHMELLSTSHELPNHPGTNRKGAQLQPISVVSGSQTTASNRKTAKNDPNSNKSGTQRLQTPKGRTIQIGTPHKMKTEALEAVRSKMRESLASALALVSQNHNSSPKKEKSPLHKVDNSPGVTAADVKLAESTSAHVDAVDGRENLKVAMQSKEMNSGDKASSGLNIFSENMAHEGVENLPEPWKSDVPDSLYNAGLPETDVSFTDSFFAKDELLQGHGLSWEWEMDMEVETKQQLQAARQVSLGGDYDEQKVRYDNLTLKMEDKMDQAASHVDVGGDKNCHNLRTPEKLAFEIEAELYKLFGGVNKKYKEKGRSLMFNLKDRNNPELRERVMSGEITPEKLCSMTAEELASKELSEWRTAKAEELAQMIVLPEDGDRRRLVKKTHKGEYQVEVDQDDGVSVEVSVGATNLTQFQLKDKETVPPSSSGTGELKDTKNVESEKSNTENLDSSYSLTIPADGTDLMQGLIEDEFKDAEFLPPIVSLDEFMESLNTEPPFDNLAADALAKSTSEKVTSEVGDKLGSSGLASKDVSRKGKTLEIDSKSTKQDAEEKFRDNAKELKQSASVDTSMTERVWEGALQLHVSALVTVIGLYRSGEKTSTTEWPSSLEIKGRVRLDAFEKFLQELPMSRSRAVMVIHFVLKAESSADDRASLREVVDSYVLDERLGFAEPASGMELYLCPPHPKILELLGKHLSKDQTEIINSTDNGLIGVVVWRKAHISSTISPNSTSHHKHSSKKQQNSRRQDKNTTVNVNMTPRASVPSTQAPMRAQTLPPGNDDDDVPPGFGPGNSRDDDDLPEFSFSGNSNSAHRRNPLNPPPPSRPVDQIRELIQKYGQHGESDRTKTLQDKRGLGRQAWNDDDDDDDIPEWRPDAPLSHVPTHPVRSFQQPMQPHLINQSLQSLPPQHVLSQPVALPPPNMLQNNNPIWQQSTGRWVAQPAPGFQQNSLGSQVNVGQFQGGAVPQVGQPPNWRRDAPRSRGF